MKTLQRRRFQSYNLGFTLVESLVVVLMVIVLTALAVRSIPALRSHQEIVTDTELIRSLLSDAKQRTLNQVRPSDCLPQLPVDSPARAVCSDVGIAIRNGEIIEFANTFRGGSNGTFTYDVNNGRSVAGDYIIYRTKLATKISGGGSAMSFLFYNVPPSVQFYRNGSLFNDTIMEKITLTASNKSKRTIQIHSLGVVDIAP